jgi:hypothetical protein
MRMRHIVIYGLPGCTFSPYYLKRGRFSKKKLLNIKCFDFSKFVFRNISYSEKNLARYDQKGTYICLHEMYPVILSCFNETRIFSTYFRKIHKYHFSYKSLQWSLSYFMRTDGRMDGHAEASSRFPQFCECA